MPHADGALAPICELVERDHRFTAADRGGMSSVGGVRNTGVSWNEHAVERFAA
jgi:hypothetical protein